MSNITLNIVEPGSGPTPGPVVPNTGLFTHGIGGTEATIIAVSTILVLALVAAIVWYCKKYTNIHLSNITKHIKTRKSIAIGLTALAILVSAGTFASLLINAGKSNTNAAEGEDSSLTVDVSSEELTVEVGDEPVFAVLQVEVSVEEATQAGYTLTAYADSTDLVSTTDPDNTIPMIAVEGDELEALTDNTYGLALVEPESESDKVYTSLPTESENAVIIKTFEEYTPTATNDTTTIYYGFYITPDTPYGTYTGSDIYYDATINTTLVTFDGKGLYFDEEQTQSTNTVEYIAVSQENNETETSSTINQPISGEYKTPSQSLPYRFLGWSTNPESTEPTYTSEDDIAEHLPISPNIPLTLYAVWQKATTITFDNNGGAGTMDTQTIIAGESANLYPNTFTKDGYTFNGWNTDEHGEGKSYADKELYQAEAESANVTLFAQWKKLPVIGDLINMQDFATLSDTDKASVLKSMTPGQQYQLKDNRDQTMYYIAKLADKNVWMTQNLDFSITNNGTGLDSTNTDVPDNWEDAGKLANTYTTGTTTWNDSYTEPESYDPGELCWNGTPGSSTTGDCNGNNSHYHLGNYYNWTAAVAMSDSSAYGDEQSGTDVNQSICPAGWRLPNNSDNKSYQNLVSRQSLTAGTSGNIQNSPVYFVYGGGWDGGSYNVGSYGYYWSSVVESSIYAYQLFFAVGGDLDPQFIDLRLYGYSLRCVAR